MADSRAPDVRAILAGTRAFRVIDFPGRAGVKVAMRLLSERELVETRISAQDRLRKVAKQRKWDDIVAASDVDPSLFDRFASAELVWHAFFDVETIAKEQPMRFFLSPEDVNDLDTTAVTALVDAYAEHVQLVTPLSSADESRTKEIVEALGKQRLSEASFSGFDRPTLLRFVTSMARLLSSSPSSSSSSG